MKKKYKKSKKIKISILIAVHGGIMKREFPIFDSIFGGLNDLIDKYDNQEYGDQGIVKI